VATALGVNEIYKELNNFFKKSLGGDKSGKDGGASKDRIQDTQQGRNDFVQSQVTSGKWSKLRGTKSGRQTWQNAERTQFYQKTKEKWEIEVYNKQGDHIGVIKPSEGILRRELAIPGRTINVK
jgi:hypothetical protein